MTEDITISTLEVRRDNWRETRVVTQQPGRELGENEVLLKADRLALTANNISYAAAGDSLGYWGFFPAEAGWGRIPAMGWGDVVASAHPDIAVGERVWGFFPLSSHLKILGGKVHAGQFSDVSPHREEYAPVYAQFDRASANPIYEKAREDQDSLLRGLFLTSWLVEDFMNVNSAFSAGACLITSASSKTSIALGHCVRQRGSLASIGITSPGNVAFCQGLGCYDRVVSYGDITSLDAAQPVVMVDMAGSAQVLGEAHHHYGDNMKYSCQVGATHYEEMGTSEGLPGATPEFFFAPGHVQTRSRELGAAQLMMQLGAAYVGFRQFCDDWLRVERSHGPEAVGRVYQQVLAGRTDPASGQIISMWEEGA
jgi:hypothetical protein